MDGANAGTEAYCPVQELAFEPAVPPSPGPAGSGAFDAEFYMCQSRFERLIGRRKCFGAASRYDNSFVMLRVVALLAIVAGQQPRCVLAKAQQPV